MSITPSSEVCRLYAWIARERSRSERQSFAERVRSCLLISHAYKAIIALNLMTNKNQERQTA